MTKVSYIEITPEFLESYQKGVQPGDTITDARIRQKNTLLSKARVEAVKKRSLFSIIADEWKTYDEAKKTAWREAAAVKNQTNWRLFIQDYCARRKAGIEDAPAPSILWQTWVANLKIEAPAVELKIKQEHPKNYYIKKKRIGKPSGFDPVLITEDLGLPFQLEVNYKSDLISAGADPYAILKADFWYSYQGRNLTSSLVLNLDLIKDWSEIKTTLTSLTSYVVRYDLYIHLHDVRGNLYLDNVRAIHSGQNWARDPYCKKINEEFKRNFYQVARHWQPEILPSGATYQTGYFEFPTISPG